MTGEVIGSYRLLEKLGEGGMGEVYLAEHKYIARRAAIKFLLPELTASPDIVSRFFSEARAASMIQHPGIVEVLDCEVHSDGRAYIVMELLSGENLRAYIGRTGKRDGDPAGALAVCRQISGALAAAHAQGIVHRDLKPDNVFLHLPTGRDPHQPIVKLLDFGIAKLMGGGESRTKTRSGQLLGTPLYMSPEQCRGGRQVDSRSDIYSLGCIMFELFCGRPPFLAEGYGDLIIAHASEPPPEPLDFAPSLMPAFRELLLACLEKAPENRPASMEEISERLAALGVADPVRVQEPVVMHARSLEPIGGAGPRSPVGWTPSPGRIATTPFTTPPPRDALGSRPRTPSSSSGAGLAQVGGTRVLPAPHPPTTFSGRAGEVVHHELPRRSPAMKIATVVVALGAVAAVVAVVWRGTDSKPGRSAETAAAATAPKVERSPESRAVTAPEEPPPAPPRDTVFRLTGLPQGATVLLDGRAATIPVTVPRGSKVHTLTVEADGYQGWERTLDATTNQTIALQLRKKATPERSSSSSRPRHKSERGHGAPGFVGFSDL